MKVELRQSVKLTESEVKKGGAVELEREAETEDRRG